MKRDDDAAAVAGGIVAAVAVAVLLATRNTRPKSEVRLGMWQVFSNRSVCVKMLSYVEDVVVNMQPENWAL
eukprot:g20631.t1